MEKKTYSHYPNLKRLGKQIPLSGYAISHTNRNIPVDDITELIGYDILEPFFARRIEGKKIQSRIRNERLTEKRRLETAKKFFAQLTESQKEHYDKFVIEYNTLFDNQEFAKAKRKLSVFRTWLYFERYPEKKAEHREKSKNRGKVIAKSLRECSHVECNLCGIILENNPNQKRRHANFHSTAQRDGRNTTQGRVVWKPSEGYTK